MSNPIHRRSVDRFMAMADGREEVSVLASEYDALESENEALRSQLTDALNRQTCEGGQPYVCHALATARSRLADIEAQNRVMWDVANDREARLAKAEARHQRVMAVIRSFCAKYAPDLLAEFDAAADSASVEGEK